MASPYGSCSLVIYLLLFNQWLIMKTIVTEIQCKLSAHRRVIMLFWICFGVRVRLWKRTSGSRQGTSRFFVHSQTQRFSLSIECLCSNRRELGSEFDIIIVVSPERWLMWNFHHFPVTMIEIKLVYTIKLSFITEGIFHGYILSFEWFVYKMFERADLLLNT